MLATCPQRSTAVDGDGVLLGATVVEGPGVGALLGVTVDEGTGVGVLVGVGVGVAKAVAVGTGVVETDTYGSPPS
jgi:hypothetical protein